MNDPIGDMLTRIRNAQMRGKSTVNSPASKLRCWVLDVLLDEGYIRGYEKTTDAAGLPHPWFFRIRGCNLRPVTHQAPSSVVLMLAN